MRQTSVGAMEGPWRFYSHCYTRYNFRLPATFVSALIQHFTKL